MPTVAWLFLILTFAPVLPSGLTNTETVLSNVINPFVGSQRKHPALQFQWMGKEADTVKGLLSHVIELDLQVLELIFISGIIEVILHHVLTHALKFDHPIHDSTRRCQYPVLHLKIGYTVLHIMPGSLQAD